jgi:lipoprotein-anchoring transpeptidase ErfK/SrfK
MTFTVSGRWSFASVLVTSAVGVAGLTLRRAIRWAKFAVIEGRVILPGDHSMLNRRLLNFVLASAMLSSVAVATPASAQGFFSFLWSDGSRESVDFSPSVAPGQIIVSFGDRRLYWVHRRGQAISYPIAVPRQQSRWQGITSVSRKAVNPDWTPTAEMRRENPKLPLHMPGGHPQNPLGVRALYLGSSMYRIHGTDAPWTIGDAVSKGCIRMYNQDVVDLYPRVPTGTRVTVTWNRFKA